MDASHYEIPQDCRYAKTDEWIRVGGTTARIGISDYAQSELSDIVFVETPEVGSQIQVGEAFGVVESVKAVNDLVAPMSGLVVQINEDLEEHPEFVNEEPYDRGWIIEIKVESPNDEHLMGMRKLGNRQHVTVVAKMDDVGQRHGGGEHVEREKHQDGGRQNSPRQSRFTRVIP